MEILDKNIPTDWAHDAVARASQVLEPLAEPFLNSSLMNNKLTGHHRTGTIGQIGRVVRAHPYAFGAGAFVLGAVTFMALRNSSSDKQLDDAASTSGKQHVRSVA